MELDDARAADALGEVLVRSAYDHALDTRIAPGRFRARSKCIICLELHHRPDYDAGRGECVFEQRELRQKLGLDARTGLLARPQSVSERLDDVIGGDGDMRCATLDH